MDDGTGWHCRIDAASGYVDVADDDPGIGPCAGLTYYECTGQSDGSESAGEPQPGDSSDTTSGCASPDVYDPYQCPDDSPLDDGHADSDEIERSCQFHGATDPEALEQCTANY
jgi:hypothetical protein